MSSSSIKYDSDTFSTTFFIFGNVFLNILSTEMINNLKKENLLSNWYITPIRNNNIISDLTVQAINDLELPDCYNRIKYDYTQLFIFGDSMIKAVPWGSVYLNKSNETFTEETFEVKKLYDKYNFSISDSFKEPFDHIGMELTFIGYLFSILNNSSSSEEKSIKLDIASLLSNYILPWFESFFEKLITNAQSSFYKLMVYLLDDFLFQVQNLLDIKINTRKIFY